ncbi:hypothetical protein D9M71_657830 [compost metagenome]
MAVRMNEVEERTLQYFLLRTGAEHRQGARIDEGTAPLALHENAEGRQLDQAAVALFAGMQLRRPLIHLAGNGHLPPGATQSGEHREKCGGHGEPEEQAFFLGRSWLAERAMGGHLQPPGTTFDLKVAMPGWFGTGGQPVDEDVLRGSRSDVRNTHAEVVVPGLGQQRSEQLFDIDHPYHIAVQLFFQLALGKSPDRNED